MAFNGSLACGLGPPAPRRPRRPLRPPRLRSAWRRAPRHHLLGHRRHHRPWRWPSPCCSGGVATGALPHRAPRRRSTARGSLIADGTRPAPVGRPDRRPSCSTGSARPLIGTFVGARALRRRRPGCSSPCSSSGMVAASWGPGATAIAARGRRRGSPCRSAWPSAALVLRRHHRPRPAWLGARWPAVDRYVYLAGRLRPAAARRGGRGHRRGGGGRSRPPSSALFLLPIPFNLRDFDQGLFGERYMAERRTILTTAVRMPFARDVPRDVQPAPDPFSDARHDRVPPRRRGRRPADPSTTPLTPEVINEFRVRLGVAQRPRRGRPTGCRTHAARSTSTRTSATCSTSAARSRIAHLRTDGRPTSRPVAVPTRSWTRHRAHHRAPGPPPAARSRHQGTSDIHACARPAA